MKMGIIVLRMFVFSVALMAVCLAAVIAKEAIRDHLWVGAIFVAIELFLAAGMVTLGVTVQ